jgi:ribonuclease HII
MTRVQPQLQELFNEPFPSISFEEQSYARGFDCVAGLDEVGRGPLAGPVVAAAVVLPRRFEHSGIKDSKLLTAAQREKLAAVIKQKALSWGLGVVEVEEIDRMNILAASFRAMVKAWRGLQPSADCILIDGSQIIPRIVFNAVEGFAGSLPRQRAIVKGDQLCLSISAASILAKVTRDAIMVDLDRIYPEYGFVGHKGYGCPAHLEALRRFGPSPVHRRSFQPVREACGEQAGPDSGFLFSTR